jgi:hypothetical protein
MNVVAIDDHVSEVDADAKSQATFLGEIQIAAGHCALNFGGTPYRVHHADEFRQHPVARGLDDAAGARGFSDQ